MLHIILLILKIIGLIIGGVAGLLILALCLLLFVPVRYHVQGSYCSKKAEGTAGLTWLLHAVSIRAVYDTKKTSGKAKLSVKLIGFTLFDTAKEKSPKKKKQKKSSKKNEEKTVDYTITVDKVKEEKQTKEKQTEEKQENTGKIEKISEAGDKTGSVQPEPEADSKETKHEKAESREGQTAQKQSIFRAFFEKFRSLFKKLKKIPLKIKGFFEGFKAKVCKFGKKISSLCKKKDRLLEILFASENRAAFSLLKHSLFAALCHILPTKVCGKIHFGMDDPEKTGSLLGKVAWLYPLYDGKLEIEPDFEKEVFEAELFFKGRIQAFTLLRIGIKIVLNKELRRILSEVKHL